MHIVFDDTQADLLVGILGRAAERFGDSKKLTDMIDFWDDLAARLNAGERTFDLEDAQARYLRKACMGARSLLRKGSEDGGFLARRAYRKQLEKHASLFALVLDG